MRAARPVSIVKMMDCVPKVAKSVLLPHHFFVWNRSSVSMGANVPRRMDTASPLMMQTVRVRKSASKTGSVLLCMVRAWRRTMRTAPTRPAVNMKTSVQPSTDSVSRRSVGTHSKTTVRCRRCQSRNDRSSRRYMCVARVPHQSLLLRVHRSHLWLRSHTR